MKKVKQLLVVALVLLAFISIGKVNDKKVYAAESLIYGGESKESATLLQYGTEGYYSTRVYKQDWYKLQTPDVPGYTTVYFKNTGMDSRANIHIYTTLDEQLYYDDYVYRGETATYNAKLENGRVYYFRITGENENCTYVMNLSFANDEVGNSKEEATSIVSGKEYKGSMDGYKDSDYYTFTAEKTGKHHFVLTNTGVDTSMTVAAYKSATDEKIAYDDYHYRGETLTWTLDLEAGQSYYFYVGGCDGYTGNYTFKMNSQNVEKITLSKNVVTLSTGNSTTIKASVLPTDAFNKNVVFASNDSNIASVDANGCITARNPGSTLITCTAQDGSGVISTCNVIVTPSKVQYVRKDTNRKSSSSISVAWNNLSNVSGYTVYVLDMKSGSYKAAKTVDANTTNATITKVAGKKLTAGTTYKVKVAAFTTVDGKKKYGAKSDTVSIPTAPAKAKITKVTNPARNTVKVSWNKVSGASGYIVYRKYDYNEEYYPAYTIEGGKKTSYTFTDYNIGTYTYKVAAYKTVDGEKYIGTPSAAKKLKKVR